MNPHKRLVRMRSQWLKTAKCFACFTILAVCLSGCAGMNPSAQTDEASSADKEKQAAEQLKDKIRLSETLGGAL
jgi:outer membrane lipoprotein-sorting protein